MDKKSGTQKALKILRECSKIIPIILIFKRLCTLIKHANLQVAKKRIISYRDISRFYPEN